jgi:predicted dehydrogenase
MDQAEVSRRAFVGAAAAYPFARAGAASDRIGIGIIGTGGRGQYHIKDLQKISGIEVTAVCDVWRPNRERAVEAVRKTWGKTPHQTTDYQELLERSDVDAVIIASPDFSHSRISKHAVEAGKDVYCEKPFGTDFPEAKAAYLAVKKSDRVVQIGTQRRSEGPLMGAAQQVQSGVLGQVTRVEFSVNFQEPRWRRDYHQVAEADVDWKRLRMYLPDKPYNSRDLREWQLFRDYTNGIAGLWMCHFIDLVPWFLGDPYPAGAVANGGVFLWKDGRQTADVFHALLDYPKGFLVSFSMSLTNSAGAKNHWYGTRGTLDADAMRITGEGSRQSDRITEEIRIQPQQASSHMQNFIDCIRTREKPRADIEAGFQHAVAVCMAGEAIEAGRRIRFDHDRLELV